MSTATMTQTRFGKTIQEAREKAGLGLRETAFKIKINPGYLSSLENNLHKAIPSDPVIKKLSDLLSLDFDKLKGLAIAINPTKAIKNRISDEDPKGMQALYKFTREHKITFSDVVKELEKSERFKK